MNINSCTYLIHILRFSDVHSFDKPNDIRALKLMNTAAKAVLNEYKDVVMAFGESDEYRWGVLSLANQTLHSQKPASYYEEQQRSIIGAAGKWTYHIQLDLAFFR